MYDITVLSGSTWYVKATVQFDPAASGSPEAVGRIVGGATDCDNYYSFEYNPFRGATGLSGDRRLIKVVGGVATVLARYPHATTTYASVSDTSILNLCWDGTTLTGWTGSGAPSGVIASRDVSISDAQAGLMVTTYVDMDAVNFTSFSLERSGGLCQACPEHCCMGPVPTSLTLEIANIDSESKAYSGGICHLDCNGLNGTFVLPRKGANGSDATAGDAVCSWKLDVPLVGTPDPPCTPATATANFVIGTSTVAGVTTITVTISHGGIGTLAILQATTTLPCSDWTNWIDLTAGGFACSLAGTNTVFRIKKT